MSYDRFLSQICRPMDEISSRSSTEERVTRHYHEKHVELISDVWGPINLNIASNKTAIGTSNIPELRRQRELAGKLGEALRNLVTSQTGSYILRIAEIGGVSFLKARFVQGLITNGRIIIFRKHAIEVELTPDELEEVIDEFQTDPKKASRFYFVKLSEDFAIDVLVWLDRYDGNDFFEDHLLMIGLKDNVQYFSRDGPLFDKLQDLEQIAVALSEVILQKKSKLNPRTPNKSPSYDLEDCISYIMDRLGFFGEKATKTVKDYFRHLANLHLIIYEDINRNSFIVNESHSLFEHLALELRQIYIQFQRDLVRERQKEAEYAEEEPPEEE